MKLHNPLYTEEICRDIFRRAKEEFAMANQWDRGHALGSYTEHFYKGVALTELLENIVGFSVGDGVYNFNKPTPKEYKQHFPEHRLLSFTKVFS